MNLIRKISKRIFMIITIFIMMVNFSFAQFNGGYPRIGIFHWGGAPIEYYAKFDMIVSSSNNSSFAQSIKQLNPNAIVLPTRDINAGDAVAQCYDEWVVRNSKGEKIMVYGRELADITDFCPQIGGKRYNEAVPDYMSTFADLSVFDGVATDGLWDCPWGDAQTDIDLDRNGVNDNLEHGRSWVCDHWRQGAGKAATGISNAIGNSKVFLVNGTMLDDYRDKFNGFNFEYGASFTYHWHTGYANYVSLMETLKEPHVIYIDGAGVWKGIREEENVRNDFQLMRFILATALLGDGYVGYQTTYKDHYLVSYFDEFDIDLGYPTSSPHKIQSNSDGCVYVRFFDHGAVVLNVKGTPTTVSDGEISSLSGYTGPYYRFRGGQDPDWNNGEAFSSSTLDGSRMDYGAKYLGDALILLTERKTIVSDIVVDNIDYVTSPGSNPAELVGSWTQECESNTWSHGCYNWIGGYQIAYTSAGSGNSYAIYRPKIGVEGNYEVYEWHGNHNGSIASNVPFEVHHSGGVANGTINQSTNVGKWNYVGTYQFSKGSDSYVKISNSANGVVLADAFKFVNIDYPIQGASNDSIPPNKPSSLSCTGQTEKSISLSWNSPSTAADGDGASYYEVYRNGSLVGSPWSNTFSDVELTDNTSYSYSVYAVDDARNKSVSAATGTFSTLADQTAPTIASVQSTSPTLVELVFSESVEKSSAENVTNYSINKNIVVLTATLSADLMTVEIATTEHLPGETYAITVNNIRDISSSQNIIRSNTVATYLGSTTPIEISVSVDNAYELYVNGNLIGSDDNWNDAETYSVPSSMSKNVIAIKAIDLEGGAGMVAEIKFGDKYFVSDERWKVSTALETDWEKTSFDDIAWSKATAYGLHGSTQPWTTYGDVSGLPTNTGVKWIWSSEQENDDVVYFRFSFSLTDMVAPDPPNGLQVKNP